RMSATFFLRILGAEQVVVVEPMVNFNVKLVVGTCVDPVHKEIVVLGVCQRTDRLVRRGKKQQEILGQGIDQISRHLRECRTIGWISRTGVGCQIIKGNKSRAYGSGGASRIITSGARIGIPKLAGRIRANSTA